MEEAQTRVVGEIDGAPAGDSLRDRAARRRAELEAERPFTLDVPGYEDMLAVRYRPLGFRELRRIGRRHESNRDRDEAELYAASDTLIQSCEGILEKHDGGASETGYKWGARAARDIFGAELPEGATARQALLASFGSNDMQMMSHFVDWDAEASRAGAEVADELSGESTASD